MQPPSPDASIDITRDSCPVTFVKAKLELEELPPGACLEVLLREGEALDNVDRSLVAEGHEVLSRTPVGNGVWRLLVRNRP